MKGFLLPGVLFAVVTLVNVIIPFHASSGVFPVPLPGRGLEIGIYDPGGTFASEPGIGIDHIFANWNMPPERTLDAVRSARTRKRALMVTIEPFPRPGQNPDTYTADLLRGQYDSLLVRHCEAVSQADSRIYVRFAHEMDLGNARYPWSNLPAETYIQIFRHAIELCRRVAPNMVSVWSPVGNAALARYYPGSASVDVVGLSLFGLQPWEEIFYGHSRRFAESFDEKYRLVSGFGKPVTIAEFGVCGTPRYRSQWLADAFRRGSAQFPLLQSLIYFNDREPYRWPDAGEAPANSGCDVEHPDWRLGRASVSR